MVRGRLTDLAAVVTIASLGLLTAWITFGLLNSQAEANFGYSIGGAFAGAFLAWGALGGMYLRFQSASGELATLRQQNLDLERKLIRGAPRPDGFESELEENHRIVLARPAKWVRRGGILFDFEAGDPSTDDPAPARFSMSFAPIRDEQQPVDSFYQDYRRQYPNPYVRSFSTEYVYVGGEPGGIRSLKVISEDVAQVTLWKDVLTGKRTTDFRWVTWDEYAQAIEAAAAVATPAPPGSVEATSDTTPSDVAPAMAERTPPNEPSGPPLSTDAADAMPVPSVIPEQSVLVALRHVRVVAYHPSLKYVYEFDFFDDEEAFTASSSDFNQILGSVRFLT